MSYVTHTNGATRTVPSDTPEYLHSSRKLRDVNLFVDKKRFQKSMRTQISLRSIPPNKSCGLLRVCGFRPHISDIAPIPFCAYRDTNQIRQPNTQSTILRMSDFEIRGCHMVTFDIRCIQKEASFGTKCNVPLVLS